MSCKWHCFDFAAGDPDCARYGLGAAALRYAYWGFAVLPLVRGGKRPARILGATGGVHHATRNPERIRAWWRSDPGMNVGIATGQPSSLAVIDLDVKSGTDGRAVFWSFLRDSRLPMPPGPYVTTPSGGAHLWLRTRERVPERPGILPGVDVKGDGGYVVAYPSAVSVVPGDRSGGTTGEVPVPYEWAAGCACSAPPWPGWMAGWLEAGSRAGQDGEGRDSQQRAGDGGASQDGLAVGSRNRGMYVLACSLYRKMGTDPAGAQYVLEDLRKVWEKTDRNGFPWSEALVCAESARRFIERSARAEDERNQAFLAWLHRRG
jgi:hypothetical protein